jgi:hypothetical protein
MRTSDHKGNLALNESKIVSDIHDAFERYGPTFVELAAGNRSDVAALLNFYGAPMRFVGDTFHLVMKDDAAIIGRDGVGGELNRLHQAHFGASTLEKWDVKVLNRQAALVDALWMRRDAVGATMERFTVKYLVTLTTEGWRITSAITTSA